MSLELGVLVMLDCLFTLPVVELAAEGLDVVIVISLDIDLTFNI